MSGGCCTGIWTGVWLHGRGPRPQGGGWQPITRRSRRGACKQQGCGAVCPQWPGCVAIAQAVGADPTWGWPQLCCSNPLRLLDFRSTLAAKFILLPFDQGLSMWLRSKECACQYRKHERQGTQEIICPGSGRSPGGGHGNPLLYSCLENPMDRGSGGLQSMGSQRV